MYKEVPFSVLTPVILLMRIINSIGINRDDPLEAIKTLNTKGQETLVENGDSLLIFPEGTRNKGDSLLPFKKGAFHLAKLCKVPIKRFLISDQSKLIDFSTFSNGQPIEVKIKILEEIPAEEVDSRTAAELEERCYREMVDAFKHLNASNDEALNFIEEKLTKY